MKNKGKRKKQYKFVDMYMVRILLQWRQKKNQTLKESGYSCNLYPNKSSEPCSSCEYFKQCHHFAWEREYIQNERKMQRDKYLRRRKQSKQKEKERILFIQFCDGESEEEPMDFEYLEEKLISQV